MILKIANEEHTISNKNEEFVKTAREDGFTDEQIVKLAFNYGFLEGVQHEAGDEMAENLIKEASDHYDATGEDYIDRLIAETTPEEDKKE